MEFKEQGNLEKVRLKITIRHIMQIQDGRNCGEIVQPVMKILCWRRGGGMEGCPSPPPTQIFMGVIKIKEGSRYTKSRLKLEQP